MATRISVISSAYCDPSSIRLRIDTQKGVTYINDKVVFRVQEPALTLHHRRVLCDVSGNSLFTLKKKFLSAHGRWEVFKHNTDSTELVFSVKRPSLSIPRNKKIDLDVFLAKNKEERAWDFKVNAGADKKSCDICVHSSSTPIATMTNNNGVFEVEVRPNVDYAFIVALLTIVREIHYFELGKTVKAVCKVAEEAVAGMCMDPNMIPLENEETDDGN